MVWRQGLVFVNLPNKNTLFYKMIDSLNKTDDFMKMIDSLNKTDDKK